MQILRLHCKDQPGIVAAVATTLSNAQCNIEESAQFHDAFSGRFFMRVVFRPLADNGLPQFRESFGAIAARLSMDWEVHDAVQPVRALVLVSRADHCLHDLFYRTRTGSLPVRITAVASNHPDLGPLAAHEKIPFHYLPVGDDRPAQEKRIARLAADAGAELILLARYMQVLSHDFCANHQGRVINIHHSFLPGFKGARPYHQAHERGVKMIGATAHFATEDLDEGPIIAQGVEPVDHGHSPEQMQQIGRDIESRVLARAARLFAERRIFLHGARTVIL